jgi:hypothetical protein
MPGDTPEMPDFDHEAINGPVFDRVRHCGVCGEPCEPLGIQPAAGYAHSAELSALAFLRSTASNTWMPPL